MLNSAAVKAKRTFILVSTLSRVKSVFMSMRACRVSLYTVPRKLSGIESWKSSPFTITRSPTVIVPAGRGRQSTLNIGLGDMHKYITTISFFSYRTILIFFQGIHSPQEMLSICLLGLEKDCFFTIKLTRVRFNNKKKSVL